MPGQSQDLNVADAHTTRSRDTTAVLSFATMRPTLEVLMPDPAFPRSSSQALFLLVLFFVSFNNGISATVTLAEPAIVMPRSATHGLSIAIKP